MTEQHARRLMNVAERYTDKPNIVFDLNATALYELAAPSTPAEVRAAVEELLIDGEKVTVADIRQSHDASVYADKNRTVRDLRENAHIERFECHGAVRALRWQKRHRVVFEHYSPTVDATVRGLGQIRKPCAFAGRHASSGAFSNQIGHCVRFECHSPPRARRSLHSRHPRSH